MSLQCVRMRLMTVLFAVLCEAGRYYLAAGDDRVVDVSRDYGLIVFTPFPKLDLNEHLLELWLDYNEEIAWEKNRNNYWWVKLYFCTNVILRQYGRCGCVRPTELDLEPPVITHLCVAVPVSDLGGMESKQQVCFRVP